MNYTNDHNLPGPIVEALKFDGYKQVGDISVTGLLTPPLIRRLRRDHDDEITVDVSDNLWLLMGSAIHAVLERQNPTNRLVEERLTVEVEGWTVSGQVDLYEQDGTVSDYKTTSVWSFQLGQKPEWEAQLNLYAWLLRQHGFPTKTVQIVALLRDWMQSKSFRDKRYPQSDVHVFDVPIWSDERCAEFAAELVRIHQHAETAPLEDVPVCTKEQRWEMEPSYAVVKEGATRATRRFKTREEAEEFIYVAGELKKGRYVVEERPGRAMRCISHRGCRVSQWCPYWQARTAGKAAPQEDDED